MTQIKKGDYVRATRKSEREAHEFVVYSVDGDYVLSDYEQYYDNDWDFQVLEPAPMKPGYYLGESEWVYCLQEDGEWVRTVDWSVCDKPEGVKRLVEEKS
jgi:hypothetical protein